jgi:hypothetical protein
VKSKTVKQTLMAFAVIVAFLIGTSMPSYAQREQPQRKKDQQQSGQQQNQGQQNNQGEQQQQGEKIKDHKQQDQQSQRGGQQHEKQREKQIEKQHKRMSKYENRLDQQVNAAEHRQRKLEQQRRRSHVSFQKLYDERMRERRKDLRDKHDHDLRNDPFFDAPPKFRYFRGGRYYDVNRYVADVLRDAVDYGYEEGYLAGRADMEDGWRYNYQDCYAYEDATFGYTGYYVDMSEYRHYFREGFRHGYEDGYYSVYHYGRYEEGRYRILADILARILYLMPLR